MAKTPTLGCKPVVGSLTPPSKKREYRVTNGLQEGKCPLYVVFNFIDSRYFNVFATVDGERVTIYQCLEGGVIAVFQSYVDADKDESYTVSWACGIDGTPLLVAGGINGIIRVIEVDVEKIHKDFHPSDIYRIASCGMDNSVKIWSMREFWTYVEKLFTRTDLPSRFPTKYVQFPVLIASIHSNYVDCNRWLGDFILSKCVDNEIVLWEPRMKELLQERERKIFVWELQSSSTDLIARLSHVQSKSSIRQTATSVDGSTILSCCEDGTIWRWDTVATS